MKKFKNIILPIAFALFMHSTADASIVPPIYVAVENDTAFDIQCNISMKSSKAAAELAILRNYIATASEDDAIKGTAIVMYITYLTQANNDGLTCVTSYHVKLYNSQRVQSGVTAKINFADVVYCDKGELITWNKNELQEQINKRIVDMVNVCISDYRNLKEY